MRLTRVTLFVLAIIISFGFYRLIIYLLDDVDAQTFQATEEVMVDTAHVMAGMIESELSENAELDAHMLQAAFDKAQSHTLEAGIAPFSTENPDFGFCRTQRAARAHGSGASDTTWPVAYGLVGQRALSEGKSLRSPVLWFCIAISMDEQ